jgi:hypothetical protein
MRRQISNDTWEQIKTAYASGVGLRELARNMDIPSGTVLARAKRDRWTQQIQCAKTQVRVVQSNAITPMQSAAITLQERGQRYAERMAGVSEKVLPHLESLPPGEILERARNVEQLDRVARRNFGLDSQPPGSCPVNLAILTNQAAIQIASPESQRPRTA